MKPDFPDNGFRDIEFRRGVSTVLRDGTRLAADIYKPSGKGSWPVLLMRQPYGKDIASTVVYAHPVYFARRGYMVVVQDVRGRGESEGVFEPFLQEIEDGAEAVEWAADLPGANGRVGMYGFSYQGYTQMAAAALQPGPLQAIAPHMAAFDLYSGWFYRNGLLQLHTTLAWANQMLREDAWRSGAQTAYALLEESWKNTSSLARALPVKGVEPLCREDLPPYGAEWIAHRQPDDYWNARNLSKVAAQCDLPAFHLGGWYDFYLRGSVQAYQDMAARRPERQFMVLGPWVHIPWGDRGHHGPSFGPQARLDTDDLLARWFDRWLKDDTTAQAATSGVRYFLLGDGSWETADRWPPPEAKPRRFYLHSGGRANSCFGDGILSGEEASGEADVFVYDPEVPVLAPGGTYDGSLAWGPANLTSAQQQNHLLVYTTKPLGSTLRIAGRPRCHLHASSTAEATAFVCRLSRLTPDGAAHFLTLGAACWDATGDPGLAIPLDDIACTFAPGDCIRLDIASSAFPLLIRHPNTRDDPAAIGSGAAFRRATQTIFHDPGAPSFLELPVLPS